MNYYVVLWDRKFHTARIKFCRWNFIRALLNFSSNKHTGSLVRLSLENLYHNVFFRFGFLACRSMLSRFFYLNGFTLTISQIISVNNLRRENPKNFWNVFFVFVNPNQKTNNLIFWFRENYFAFLSSSIWRKMKLKQTKK